MLFSELKTGDTFRFTVESKVDEMFLCGQFVKTSENFAYTVIFGKKCEVRIDPTTIIERA